MSWDNPAMMPLYHVQLETSCRIISYEIGTQNFNYAEVAKAHLSQRLIKGEGYIHVGGSDFIGYVAKNEFAQILEAKVTRGQPFEENEE